MGTFVIEWLAAQHRAEDHRLFVESLENLTG
jgi:hypothetical protein